MTTVTTNINDERLMYMEAIHKTKSIKDDIDHAKERAAFLAVLLHSFGSSKPFTMYEMNGAIGLFGITAKPYEPNTFAARMALRVRHFVNRLIDLRMISKLDRFHYQVDINAVIEFQQYLEAHPNKDKNAAIFGALDVKYFLIDKTALAHEKGL
jgi:hypothetical protein